MSEALRKDPGLERTARVWQSADFQRAGSGGAVFQPSVWRTGAVARFTVPSLTPPQDEPEDIAAESDAAPLDPSEPALLAPVAEPEPPSGQFSQEDLEQVRLEAYEQGKQHGLREAMEHVRAEAGRAQQEAVARIGMLERAVGELTQSGDRLYEPLKRLALHLAEQLVIGELSVSHQAIERLVRRCVDELDAQRGAAVIVELHPDDLAVMQALMNSLNPDAAEAGDAGKSAQAWTLQANAALMPGSVRVSASDAVVSDLIEHRLEALARQLLVSPGRASEQSALRSDRVAARRAEVSQVLDAQPRMAPTPRSNRFGTVIDTEVSPMDDTGSEPGLPGPSMGDPEPAP